jgi:hypothetical protein
VSLVELQRQRLQVRVKVVAQIVFDVSRHIDQDAPLGEQENALAQRYQNQQAAISQRLPANRLGRHNIQRAALVNASIFRGRLGPNLSRETIHCPPHNAGTLKFHHVHHEDAEDAKDELTGVRRKVTQ